MSRKPRVDVRVQTVEPHSRLLFFARTAQRCYRQMRFSEFVVDCVRLESFRLESAGMRCSGRALDWRARARDAQGERLIGERGHEMLRESF
eukprot:905931-Prorocentrum_minimum.AAC.1